MTNQMTACYYPTTVLLVDDDRKFLEGVGEQLVTDGICHRDFDTGDACLKYFESEYSPASLTRRNVLWLDEKLFIW